MTIPELYLLFLKHPVVTTDSRHCPSGSLFFALKGETFDGNAFAEQALRLGCSYAIVDDASIVTDERIILVDHVLSTLQQLANFHRKNFKIPVIGITGTNGKTTTKELTNAVLKQKYNVLSTQGNLNNHIGVPLTLLRMTDEHEIAVIEMGANHLGEIGELTSILCPDFGLITNVGYAHLEGFGSLEGVIKTKGALYDFLRITNGAIFIHRENHYLTAIAEGIKQITYGAMDKTNDGFAAVKDPASGIGNENASLRDETSFTGGRTTAHYPFLSFEWHHNGGESYTIQTKLVGAYNLWNALAAIAIGVYFDVPPEKINEAITNYEPTNNRSQLKKTKHNNLIIDTYNANPSSMGAALENFAAMPYHPKAIILGDMRELGEKSDELHATVIKQVEACNFEKVLLCGEHFSAAGPQYVCFPAVEALNKHLEANPLHGFHILIKGSRGISLEKSIELL